MNDAKTEAGTIGEQSVALLEALGHAGKVTEAKLDAALSSAGLSAAKWWAMRHLALVREPLPLRRLAQRMDCAKSNATQMLDRLEAEGLAERVPDPSDRRGVLARLTEEGKRRYRAGAHALAEAEEGLFGGYSPGERKELLLLLGRLNGGRR